MDSGIKSGLSRMEQIAKCTDNLEHIQDYLSNPRYPYEDPINNMIGQMDWWEELHRLLYEEEDDGIR